MFCYMLRSLKFLFYFAIVFYLLLSPIELFCENRKIVENSMSLFLNTCLMLISFYQAQHTLESCSALEVEKKKNQ